MSHNIARDWRARLRTARRFLRLTQSEVGSRAGVSLDTVRAYETGRRTPEDREILVRVLRAVELSRIETNEILAELGFAPMLDFPIPADSDTWLGRSTQQSLVDHVPWPAFAVNDLVEVVAGNDAFQALFGVDLRREYTEPSSRTLLALATTPRFADHVENWDEAVGTLIAVWKGGFTNVASLDEPTPYVSRMLESAAAGDPGYLHRLVKIWDEVALIPPIRRWFYPIIWRDDEFGQLRFQALVNTGDDPSTLISFNDWIPTDAGTWTALEGINARHARLVSR